MQPDPIDEELISAATAEAAGRKHLPGLARLHKAIAEAGYRPRGRHHEIYLGDPRRSAPEKLRTIIRHPVEPVPGPA